MGVISTKHPLPISDSPFEHCNGRVLIIIGEVRHTQLAPCQERGAVILADDEIAIADQLGAQLRQLAQMAA